MKKDALGNPIIIGGKYGYSQHTNGLTNVRVGRVVRETKEKVTIKVEEAKRAAYSDDLKDEPMTKQHISVKSNMLFPVQDFSDETDPIKIFEEENKKFFEEKQEWEKEHRFKDDLGEYDSPPYPYNKGYNFSASKTAIERAMKRYAEIKIKEKEDIK